MDRFAPPSRGFKALPSGMDQWLSPARGRLDAGRGLVSGPGFGAMPPMRGPIGIPSMPGRGPVGFGNGERPAHDPWAAFARPMARRGF